MSLDSLFQQILLTEQKAEEKRRLMHQVKQKITLVREKAEQITEQLNEAKRKLEAEMNTKRKIAIEEEKFLKEITDFNIEYGLTSNRELLIKKRVKAEICELEEKENVLRNEIESMEHENAQLKMFQLQKNELKQDLLTLQRKLKDSEEEIREAKCITKHLETEKIKISERPQTDPEYVRLKKELESYKEDEMENACEALQTEIEFLQMMFGVWFIALFLHVIVRGSEMCYSRLGCFTNKPPWGGTLQRPVLGFPEPPEVVNTAFLLYTRENPTHFQVISAIHPSTIRISHFRTSRITRFIIHGYLVGDDDYHHIVEMCKLLLLKEDINCIVVNWEAGATNLYLEAVQNIRIVGAELAYLLDYLEKNCGYSPSNVHIIGHSLGAHAGGEAGRRKRGLSRITGLDPAGPLFHNTPPEVRLDPSDAKFVDVIHTNIGRLFFEFATGIIEPCGHLDFYPNGGKTMPGCKKVHLSPKWRDINGAMREIMSSKSAGCSHKRSLQYYFESISIPDGFLGYRCNTYDTFLSGKCFPCQKEGCPMMGHYADCFANKTKEVHQVYYLNTGAFSPFACWRAHVSVELIATQTMRGDITVAFIGTNELRRQYTIANGFFYPSHSYARFVDVDIPGNVTAAEFQWRKHPGWKSIGRIGAQEVTILYGKNGHKSVFCGIKAIQPEVWQKLTPC